MHTNTYFAHFRYFAYMDVSWARSVLQLCEGKTSSNISVLSLGKGFGRYYLFLVISAETLQQRQFCFQE